MTAEDLTRPGHILPLRAMPGGVLRRAGHTEAAVDLARMAGRYPAGVICEVLDEDGSMARVDQLTALAARHGLKMITIKDLIEYRIMKEKLVRRIATHKLPTDFGDFTAIAYDTTVDSRVPVATLNLSGRVFMNGAMDDPFTVGRREVEALRKEAAVIIVDMHGEASSEKMAMGYHLDGSVSAVVGTRGEWMS